MCSATGSYARTHARTHTPERDLSSARAVLVKRASQRHLSREQPLEIDDRIAVGGHAAIVRTIEPLLGEPELHLVLRLLQENDNGPLLPAIQHRQHLAILQGLLKSSDGLEPSNLLTEQGAG